MVFFLFFGFLGPHMEVPRLEVELELQLPAYTTATAVQDPSCILELHCSSQQRQILNPQSEARDQTLILMDTSRVHNPLSHYRNSQGSFQVPLNTHMVANLLDTPFGFISLG